MQLTPSMQANSSAGIISATETSGGSAVAVCAGANALYTTFDYQGSRWGLQLAVHCQGMGHCCCLHCC